MQLLRIYDGSFNLSPETEEIPRKNKFYARSGNRAVKQWIQDSQ